jgi:hypothetical protein
VVNITTSEDGEVFYYYGINAIQIEADEWDHRNLVLKVEFFADDVKIGEDYDGRDGWKINWQNYKPGTYCLTAKATDNVGAITVLPIAKITVTDVAPK